MGLILQREVCMLSKLVERAKIQILGQLHFAERDCNINAPRARARTVASAEHVAVAVNNTTRG